jgi:hypothetical protein
MYYADKVGAQQEILGVHDIEAVSFWEVYRRRLVTTEQSEVERMATVPQRF